MATYGSSRVDGVAFRLCHALVILIKTNTSHLIEDLSVFRATLRVKTLKQLLKKNILIDGLFNLPVITFSCLCLISQVLVSDDIVVELRDCAFLTLQKAGIKKERTQSVQTNNVKNIVLLAQSIYSYFKLLISFFSSLVAEALSQAPLKAAQAIVAESYEEKLA